MPMVRIDLVKGRSEARIRAVADAVHAAVVEVLAVPERDRFQIVTQHDADEIVALDAGLGFERGPGAVIVHIFTQRGRGVEEKQRLYKALAERLSAAGVDGKDLFIGFFENGPEDWSFADGRAQYVEGDLAVPGR